MPGSDAPANTADPHSTGGDADRAPPSLLCVDGDRSFSVTVPPAGELVIGRGPDAGVSLEDALVSRAHARILAAPDGLRISVGTDAEVDRLLEELRGMV